MSTKRAAFRQKKVHPKQRKRPNVLLMASSPVHYHSLLLGSSDDDSGCVMDEVYAWVPPRIKPDLVDLFFAALPPEKVPRIGTAGEIWRQRQMERQLPPQDADTRFCVNLSAQEECEFEAFVRTRHANSLGRGEVRRLSPASVGTSKLYCHQCKNCFVSDQIAVWAPRHFGTRAFWHPKCFVCVECGELLVDLIHFAHAQNIFCGRHHAEMVKGRCSNCDELIFSEECTEAEGRIWHMRHFCCGRCGVPLGGQRYVISSKQAQPMCMPCCRQSAANLSCAKCAKQIMADRPHIAQGILHWHADKRCFCCSVCQQRALLGQPFSSLSNGHLFCALHGNSSRILLPPPFAPPPPPGAVQQRFCPIPLPRNGTVLATENVYETVAAPPPPPSASSGHSANASMSTSACERAPAAQANAHLPHLWKPKRNASESSEVEEKPLRRCQSADGRGERGRRSAKIKNTNKIGSIGIGNLYSGAPPAQNARKQTPARHRDGDSLMAALALASTRLTDRRKRRQCRRGERRRRQKFYWESPNRSPSFSSSSSSAPSSSASSSSSDNDEFYDPPLLRLYLHAFATRSASSSVCESPASKRCVPPVRPQLQPFCRVATTRPTTVKSLKTQTRRGANSNAGNNCRIS